MNQHPCKQLSCFGQLDCVFPKSGDGLRHTPTGCQQCPAKVDCLRAAVNSEDGQIVKEEKMDRAYASGHIGFLERWAQKKTYRQRKKGQGRFAKCLRLLKK